MRPNTMPATSSSSRATSLANRMTPAEAAALVEDLHAPLQPIDGHPTRYSVPSSLAPTPQQRKQLCAVVEHLAHSLEKLGDLAEREYEISLLLLGYEKGKGSEFNAGLLNARFLKAVEGLPLAAIRDACERFTTGRTLLETERGWRPSPDLFAAEVREGMIPLRGRLVRARRILAAEVYEPPTPEQLEKVKAAAEAYLEAHKFPAERRPGLDARDELPVHALETVRPITGSISHLMANLDRRKAVA